MTSTHTIYRVTGALLPRFLCPGNPPVFIIGTGRCGSSLLIEILESHPALLRYPGERNKLWQPKSYPFVSRTIETPAIVENPALFTENSIENWPQDHSRFIQHTLTGYHVLRGFNKILILKSAMISFFIPKLLSMFPAAKFIHVFRNGPSVVASFVHKEWAKYDNYYGSKTEYEKDCAKYWRDCLIEIDKRSAEFSLQEKGQFLEFSYESLCSSPQTVIGDIADFLQVPPGGFAFDMSKIVGQNYKVGDYTSDKRWVELLELMAPAMQMKGYPL